MRGAALSLVIWLLALLAILAAVFVSSSQTESTVTRNFTDEQIAKNLAFSDIEYGKSKLETTLSRGFFDNNGNMRVTV